MISYRPTKMDNARFIRWQGLAITQLSVAVSIVSGFSVAGLALGASSLLQGQEPRPSMLGLVAMGFLLLAAFCSCAAVITRLIDFRLTARKVMKDMKPDYDKPLLIFWRDKDEYSRATWRLFWAGQIAFLIGASLLVVIFAQAYVSRIAWTV